MSNTKLSLTTKLKRFVLFASLKTATLFKTGTQREHPEKNIDKTNHPNG
jgi:hypothetical protein